jgi:PAS domain S-box-containing protein
LLQHQEILRQREEQYRSLVEGVTDHAIFMLDPVGNIVNWNIGAERLLGYRAETIVGQPWSRLFDQADIQQGVPEQVLKTAIEQGFAKANYCSLRQDRTSFWSHYVITPLWKEAGQIRGFSLIMQDITVCHQVEEERERLLEMEKAARAEAETVNQLKDEFLAILSHELRTPLTAIVGWIGMLETNQLDTATAAIALETIERNANLQLQLIDDLLDVSRIIRGEIPLNCRSIDLVEVITGAIEIIQPTANAKSLKLDFIRDSTTTATVLEQPLEHSPFLMWGDFDRLQQVILNLLSNAIKFTSQGGQVKVCLSLVSRTLPVSSEPIASHALKAKNHNLFAPAQQLEQPLLSQPLKIGSYQARIQVIDNGIGIPAHFLPYVFDRFRQVDSTNAREHKGLGLGLAIVRHIVELHGGAIEGMSAGHQQGATFMVTLPLRSGLRCGF